MPRTRWEWFSRHRSRVMSVAMVLLLFIAAIEGIFLYQHWKATHATEEQSAKLLDTFLKGDTTEVPVTTGVPIRMQNVRFKWSDKVYIDTDDIAVRAVPLEGTVVNFDDLSSFRLKLQQSVITITPEVLEGMFNESVFNYPHSKLRDLKVTVKESDKERLVNVEGSVNTGLWIPFKMDVELGVDTKTNTLVMDVKHLKVLGVLPVISLIKLKPFNLENIVSLPPNNQLIVHKNDLMVKPFGLFPPPRVDGKMAKVDVEEKAIRLTFAGDPIPAPRSTAKNYVYLRGGTSQFGHIRMFDTDILILDQDPSDPFVFSLVHYADMVPRSRIEVHDTKSARVTMPDF